MGRRHDPPTSTKIRIGVCELVLRSARRIIPKALHVNLRPSSEGDGPHDVGVGEGAVPGLAAGLDDGGGVVPDLEAEPVLAQLGPDVLDRVELGAVGWQWQHRDGLWQAQGG